MSYLTKLNTVLVFFSCLVYVGVFRGLLGVEGFDSESTTLQVYNRYLFVFAYLVFFMNVNWLKLRPNAIYPFIIFTCFMVFYCLLSISYQESFQRLLMLYGGVGLALFFLTRFSEKGAVFFLQKVLLSSLLISMCVVYLFPDFGVHSDSEHLGRWRGVFGHKNWFGKIAFCSFFFSVFAFYIEPGKVSKGFYLSCAALAVVVILQTASATSLIVVAISISLLLLRPVFLRIKQKFLSFVLLIALLLSVYFVSMDLVLSVLGKGANISGRDIIWSEVSKAFSDRPLFGYGYYAFWFGERNGVWNYITYPWVVTLSDPHSGYFNLLINFGLIGASMFVIMYLYIMRKYLIIFKFSKFKYLAFVWLVVYAIYNAVETSFFQINDILFVVMMVFFMQCNKEKYFHMS